MLKVEKKKRTAIESQIIESLRDVNKQEQFWVIDNHDTIRDTSGYRYQGHLGIYVTNGRERTI